MTGVLRSCAALVLAAILAGGARAEFVPDLYLGEVPVDDRSQAALSGAARQALAQVLVKVSGRQGVLDNAALAPALNDALDLAQQFSYARDTSGDTPRLLARFEYDSQWLNQLLTRAGEPLWTANRPAVLLWLVQDTVSGREFVGPDSAPGVLADIRGAFARRGVPLRTPLLDLADTAALPPSQAWRQGAPGLRQASARYGVEHVLAGRVTRLSNGQWLGDWAYLAGDTRLDRSVGPVALDTFIEAGAAMVAEELASRYAVAASGSSPAAGLPMRVTQVRSYGDYAAVVAWLEGLEVIDRADVQEVRGDTLDLRLHARVGAAQLAPLIELNRQLVPGASPGELHYQWRRP